jgi:microcystin-dependent protein
MALIAGVQYSGSPVGTIMSFSGASAPARTLLCNGDIIPGTGIQTVQGVTADFTALYNLLGSTYGSTGQLPDTRNVFLRGANASTRTIGSISYPAVTRGATTNDKMQGHIHTSNDAVNKTGGYSATGAVQSLWYSGTTQSNTTNPTADGTNGTPRTGTETAPVNLGVNYCIAY